MKKAIRLRFRMNELKTGCKDCWSIQEGETLYIDEFEEIEQLIKKYNKILNEKELGCSVSLYLDVSTNYNSMIGYLYNNTFEITGYNKYIYKKMKEYYQGSRDIELINSFNSIEIINDVKDYIKRYSLELDEKEIVKFKI